MFETSDQTSSPAYRLPADTPPPPAFGPPPDRPARRKRWPWIAGAAGLLVTVGAVTALALTDQPSDKRQPGAGQTQAAAEIRIGGPCTEHGATATAVDETIVRCEGGTWRRPIIETAAPVTAPETLTVVGMFTVTNATCTAIQSGKQWGYKDVPGSQVRVTGPSGEILGVTNLPDKGVDIDKGTCTYGFNVPGVDAGLDFYGVEVGRRGKVVFTGAQIADGIDLTLGD